MRLKVYIDKENVFEQRCICYKHNSYSSVCSDINAIIFRDKMPKNKDVYVNLKSIRWFSCWENYNIQKNNIGNGGNFTFEEEFPRTKPIGYEKDFNGIYEFIKEYAFVFHVQYISGFGSCV